MDKPVLKAGTLAYWVTPFNRYSVKVVSIAAKETRDGWRYETVIEFTRDSGAYRRGERTIFDDRPRTLMPRGCYHVKRGSYGRSWWAMPFDIECNPETN